MQDKSPKRIQKEHNQYIEKLKQEQVYNINQEDGRSQVTLNEVYMFLNWLTTALLAVFFSIWWFMPESVLEKYADYLYLPKRDYMMGFANWIGVTLVFGTLSLYFLSMSRSKPNNSLFTV